MTTSTKRHPLAILLDIEGTVSPIEFVHRELFPFVRDHLVEYLTQQREADPLRHVCAQIIAEADNTTADKTCDLNDRATLERVVDVVRMFMDRDAKLTGLKQLQGMIWQKGFEAGELLAPVFPDVPPFLQRCRDAQIPVSIYSSGSIQAQQLFFEYTQAGDLRSCLAGYFDTTSGPKRESSSYTAITQKLAQDAGQVLFASDVVAELDAARQAGLQTLLCLRPGNPPVTDAHRHPTQSNLDGIP